MKVVLLVGQCGVSVGRIGYVQGHRDGMVSVYFDGQPLAIWVKPGDLQWGNPC